MSSSKKTKLIENDENKCPLPRKRSKQELLKIITADDNTDILNEMGINMLESDESSSSVSAIVLALSGSSEENSNEATPNLDAAKMCHHALVDNRVLNLSIDSDTTDDSSFVDLNETMKANNNKNSNNNNINIDLYPDNNNKALLSDKLHNKKMLLSAIANNQKINRSPLSAVPYNTSYTSSSSNGNQTSTTVSSTITAAVPSTSTVDVNSIKKQIFMPDENFFLYRNRAQTGCAGKDHFKRLSDEMILQVFKWLPKKALMRCSNVCDRFYHLSQDESLWTRLDLGAKCLRAGAMSQVITRGVVILRLAQSEMAHPIFDAEFISSYPEFQSKLQFLDLSMAVITKPSIKALLSRCRNLKKLSLEHVKINDEICAEIAQNVNLEALNLAMCEGIEAWSIRTLLSALKNLSSLNISWTWLDVDAVSAVVSHVNPNLMRLNVAGCRKTMFDSHLVVLLKRCTQLLELDVSDCTGLSSDSIRIICKFNALEYLSLSRCYGISTTSYMDLCNLPSLKFLDVFGILSDSALEMLENTFPNLGINKFFHSSVARPTVGTRRTSIWGLRTRD